MARSSLVFSVILCAFLLGAFSKTIADDRVQQKPLAVHMRYLGRNLAGQEVVETSHFRIFHNQKNELVEGIVLIADKTRMAAAHRWFGNNGDAWESKCEIILHANALEYIRLTGSNALPGVTTISIDKSGQRVLTRRIDLCFDAANMAEDVLPHEVTHVVLAGQFGRYLPPRWADEGIAELSESSKRVSQYRSNLIKLSKDRTVFGLKELMLTKDYPAAARMEMFHAQSACLVDFLAQERDSKVFIVFVRDGLRDGYEAALLRHYKMNFVDLEKKWQQFLVTDAKGR